MARRRSRSSHTSPPPVSTPTPRWIVFTLLTAITTAHAIGLVLIFSPVSGAWSANPVIDQDWGLHFHHLQSMLALHASTGRFWGYNPLFMAGYVSNTIQDFSVKGFELTAWIASRAGLDATRGFKLAYLVTTSAVPIACYGAARLFDPEPARAARSGLVGAALGTLYWWSGYPREMVSYGMIGLPLGFILAILGGALWFRLVTAARLTTTVVALWLVTGVLVVPMHLEAVIVVGIIGAATWLTSARARARRLIVWALGAAALSIVVNAIWLVPLVRHLDDQNSAVMLSIVSLFASPTPTAAVLDYFTPGGLWTFRQTLWANGLRWSLLLVGLWAVRRRWTTSRDAAITLGAAIAVLFVFTYFGSLVPDLVNLQPLRFKIPLDLLLLVALAPSVADAWPTPARLTLPRWILPVMAAGAISAALAVTKTEAAGIMRLRTMVPPDEQRIADWIAHDTSKDARVLFEESGEESDFVHDGMYLSSFLPHWTGRSLIGGPINAYDDRHFFAEFHSGVLFTHPIEALGQDAIAAYLRTYNIGAIATFTPAAIRKFGTLGAVHEAGHVGRVALFIVDQPRDWFLRGGGRVRAEVGALQLDDLRGDDVLLKFHWSPDLRATPAADLEPERVLDDPSPFIRIRHGPSSLTIVAK